MLKIYDIMPLDNPNEIKIREYSDFLRWSFKCDTSDFKGWMCTYSGYDIKRGTLEGSPVSSEHYDTWKQQIVNWINENNQRIYDGDLNGHEIEYKMLDVDEDSAYTYEKYVDGHLAKTGKGWLKDLEYKFEKEAWRKAVKEYKKANGIETESDKMKRKQDKTNQKIKDLDSSLPEKTEEIPPTILNAIAKAQSDPCEFISEIISKGVMGVTGVSPKELFNYYTKVIKNNISVETYKIANSQTAIVEQFYKPVEEQIVDTTEYFAQLDTDREEYLKTHSDDICLFKVVEMEYPKFPNPEPISSSTQTSSSTGKTSKDYGTTPTNGSLEWNKKGANEEVITQKGKLWKIISADLGATPTSSQANASMITIEVKTRNEDGVMTMRKIRVHKAAVGTVKKIFEEIYNTTNFKVISKQSFQLGGFNHRFVRGSTTALSQHSFGSAIDLNPIVNPMKGSKSKDVEKQTDANNNDTEMRTVNHKVVKIMAKYGYGWGGCYSDYMHFSCKTYTKQPHGWFSGY
jgi:hypothetical protein